MSTITLPTQKQIESIVAPVTSAHRRVGFAIGVASPQFDAPQLYFVGELPNYRDEHLVNGPNTYFELASNTKIFTAALLAYYAQQDPSLMSAAITSFTPPEMPALPTAFSGITLQNLANYTSGLPQDNENPTDLPPYLPQPYTSASMYGYLNHGNVPVTNTGSYTYSNLAVSLLADALPQVAGSSQGFVQLVAENITQPLGMTGTWPFTEIPVTALPLGICGNQAEPSGWPAFPAYLGAGGLVSTAQDMSIWLQFHMGMLTSSLNGILAPMQTPSATYGSWQLGLGWFFMSISAQDGGQTVSLPVVWKDGGLVGCSSYVTFLQSPEPGTTPSQAGVFVLTNSTLPEDGAQVGLSVLRLMNGYDY